MSTITHQNRTVDPAAVESFLGRAVCDAGAALSVLLTHLGDRLGLFAAMADGEPVTPDDLAERTGTESHIVREWLADQAVGGYVAHDAATGCFRLPPEQAFALADESSPALVQGLFDTVAAVYRSIDEELQALRSGSGLGWGDHHPELFPATERSFRPGYRAHLVQEWIPALEGMPERLTSGARVADVGCGHGTATLLLAEAYPNATLVGYDSHPASVAVARAAAAQAGVADRVSFETADATEISGPCDLIAFFDAWHDTADPLGAAAAARRALTDDGSVLLVEPSAHDRLEDNCTPLGRLFYGASALICTPCSVSGGGPGLGAQVGPARTGEIFHEAGFSRFRRAAETTLNAVYEARP